MGLVRSGILLRLTRTKRRKPEMNNYLNEGQTWMEGGFAMFFVLFFRKTKSSIANFTVSFAYGSLPFPIKRKPINIDGDKL